MKNDAATKGDIEELRTEMGAKFDAIDSKFDKVDTAIENMRSDMKDFKDEMQKTMAQYAKSVSEEMRSLVSIFDEKYNHVPKNLQGLDDRFEEHKKDPKAHAGISSAS